MRKAVRKVVVRVLLVGLIGGASVARAEGEGEDVKVGDQAPSFTLPLYNAEAQRRAMFSLDSFVGSDADEPNVKVLLMSFFATFCAPCKREMPYLEQLQEQYRDLGLRVVMISIDRDDEAVGKIETLAKQNHISFPILKDRFNFLARRYLGETAPLPSVFIVGRDGMVKELNRGYGKDASTFLLNSVQKALGVTSGGGKTGNAVAPRPR